MSTDRTRDPRSAAQRIVDILADLTELCIDHLAAGDIAKRAVKEAVDSAELEGK